MSAPEKAIVILKATLDMVRVLGAPLFSNGAQLTLRFRVDNAPLVPVFSCRLMNNLSVISNYDYQFALLFLSSTNA